MKISELKLFVVLVLVSVLCLVLLTGCGQKLSSDFNEEDVKIAAEKVISLINDNNSESLRELCTVQMRDALIDDVLSKIFKSIAEGGKFENIQDISVAGAVDKSNGEEFAVVVVKAKYEIKTFTYTISFTKQMKLAGLYYK